MCSLKGKEKKKSRNGDGAVIQSEGLTGAGSTAKGITAMALYLPPKPVQSSP